MNRGTKILSQFALILIFMPLFLAHLSAITEPDPRLTDAVGKERLDILMELTETNWRKAPKEALEYGLEALQLSQKLPDPHRKTILNNVLAKVTYSLGDYKASKEYACRAIQLARLHKDKKNHADALIAISRIHKKRGEYSRSEDDIKEAEKLYRQIPHKEGIADSHYYLSILYWEMALYSKSLEYSISARTQYEKLGNRDGYGRTNSLIGVIYGEMGEYDKSLEYFNDNYEWAKQKNDLRNIAAQLVNMGVNHHKLGNLQEALAKFQQGLKIYRDLGIKGTEANCLNNIGEVYAEMKQHSRALQYYRQGLQMRRQLNDRRGISSSLTSMGKSYRLMGNYQKALQYQKQAYRLATNHSFSSVAIKAAMELSEIYTNLKDYKNALEYFKKYKNASDTIYNREGQKKILEMQTLLTKEKKEKEISLLKKDGEIQRLSLGREKSIKDYFVIISSLIFILALAIFIRYRLKTKANRALIKEINLHKQTTQKLKDSEEKFRVLAEKSMVGIFIARQNKILYVNPRLLSIFEYEQQEIIGQSPFHLAADDDRRLLEEHFDNLVEEAGAHDAPKSWEFNGSTKKGIKIHLECHATQTIYQGQNAMLATIIDITDRKRTESELIKSQKLESIGLLAGGIAHDFNNLLNIMTGNLSRTIDRCSNKTSVVQMLEAAANASFQAAELADKLITFSEGGWFMPEKVKLTTILNETAEYYPKLKPYIECTQLPQDLKPIFGDARQLRQVMQNLLQNANDAIPEHKEKQVTVEAKNISVNHNNNHALQSGDYVEVSISDNGKGIPPDHLEKVFDPYFSTKDTAYQKGMGLGLAICYSIVKKHKGSINISSDTAKGTTITLYLPASRH
jgi:PAS domain S-box-containing protein